MGAGPRIRGGQIPTSGNTGQNRVTRNEARTQGPSTTLGMTMYARITMPKPSQGGAVVFLGGGRITSALAAGLRVSGSKKTLLVYDRNPGKLRALIRESRVEGVRDLRSAILRAKMLIIAVRPQSVKGMLQEVAGCGAPPKLCVSLAAGIPLATLRLGLPQARWVRAMPSPVCRMGRGLTALCFDRRVSEDERQLVSEFFARVGRVVEVPEQQFDAFTATYSSSHGYHALSTLAAAAKREGLNTKTALAAAAHALADGILYWRESEMSLDDLLTEAATPGGIAATTMAAMNRAGYSRAIAKGIEAGIRQARRNAREHALRRRS